jgi:hypothetical protein
MRFYTVEQLGPNRAITPEGFLLCTDVSVARTGEQIYGEGETPIKPGPDGLVHILREEKEVFRPETISSANGKSLVNDHPENDVAPHNWTELTVGVVLNPHRGSGDRANELLADILITDANAIELVQGGKVELSCGYDANYEDDPDVPGKGWQTDIIINHVALVDQGRCGSKCKIRDRDSVCGCTGGKTMAKKSTVQRFKDALQGRWGKVQDAIRKAADEADPNKKEEEMEKALDCMADAAKEEAEEGRTKWDDDALDNRFDEIDANHKAHDSRLKAHDSRLDSLEEEEGESAEDAKKVEDALEEEGPEEEIADKAGKDRVRKAKDSKYLDGSFKTTLSLAEIMAPGLHFPVYDAKAAPKSTYDAMCGLRRKALGVAAGTADGAAIIAEIRGGRVTTADSVRTMDCKDVRSLFLATGTAMRGKRTGTSDRMSMATTDKPGDPTNLSENEMNRKFWEAQK